MNSKWILVKKEVRLSICLVSQKEDQSATFIKNAHLELKVCALVH